ncbi:MAG: DNA-3-methyladenine glycosylase 2 family protein [Desulfobacter sp.]|nr:MAG: DNA-3-methyladenine glycosylase 2 family protein [Desulfobacter sp.]
MIKEAYRIARITKDKNFDGKFFFGVKTTGVFCRPSCPAPTAKEENVVYFNDIFEALDRFYRPCLRCRPDIRLDYCNAHPRGTLTVQTALKMIYDGYLNTHGVTDLAKTLKISDRHLRQLFIDNLGVPPVKLARYHRALFAKKLLMFSNQSVTDIAFASGFGSIRQFNQVFKEIFGMTPSAVKKETNASEGGNTALLLPYETPFNFSQILEFMKIRVIKGVERIHKGTYARTFRTKGAKGYFTVRDNPGKSALELGIFCDDIRCYMEIHNRVRRMFDLDTRFSHINKKFKTDPCLSKGMKEGHVPRLPVAFDAFELCIRAILGQQISVQAASTLASRIAEKAGRKTDNFPHGLDYFFPGPGELAETGLAGMGITGARQATIANTVQGLMAQAFSLNPNQSFETFEKEFSAIRGIGEWTVNYVAMRGLGMVDSFPATDLGIIKALAQKEKRPGKKEILKRAENWRPYRAYAALCLWNR